MITLRKKIAKQKRQKEELELQILNLYGGSEKGLEKEEQMNAIMAENRLLQSKLDELQKEQAEIQAYKMQVGSKQTKTNEELTEINAALLDVKTKFKDLNRQNQALYEARESYFTVLKDNARLKSQVRGGTQRNLQISNSQNQLATPVASNRFTFKSTRHSQVNEGLNRLSPKVETEEKSANTEPIGQ